MHLSAVRHTTSQTYLGADLPLHGGAWLQRPLLEVVVAAVVALHHRRRPLSRLLRRRRRLHRHLRCHLRRPLSRPLRCHLHRPACAAA